MNDDLLARVEKTFGTVLALLDESADDRAHVGWEILATGASNDLYKLWSEIEHVIREHQRLTAPAA